MSPRPEDQSSKSGDFGLCNSDFTGCAANGGVVPIDLLRAGLHPGATLHLKCCDHPRSFAAPNSKVANTSMTFRNPESTSQRLARPNKKREICVVNSGFWPRICFSLVAQEKPAEFATDIWVGLSHPGIPSFMILLI